MENGIETLSFSGEKNLVIYVYEKGLPKLLEMHIIKRQTSISFAPK